MAISLTPGGRVFLDTAYAVALASTSDAYHQHALALADELEANATLLVTTWGVLLEIGNALSKVHYRHAAFQLLSALQQDASVEIVPLSGPLLQRAVALYGVRPDKEWGLTDCVSFVVMEERGIRDALTADEHFKQAGFRPLLREFQGSQK
jgi:predicted nucleic acid-binding protein